MSEIDLGDTVFSDGKDYYKALSLEGGAYSYYFTASDMYEVQAVGDPIREKNGPAVVNGAPTSGVKVYHSVFKPGQAEKTYISFNPSAAGNTTVKIYDTAGRAVRTLYDGPSAPGINTVTWDGTDSGGAKLSSGVYLIRIEGPGIKQQKKVVAIR